jgi:1-acyl-sn-glycerol-3-phosphate acyltransferase
MSDRRAGNGTGTGARTSATIPGVMAAAVALTLTAPVWAPLAALADLARGRRRLPTARLLAFAVCWAWLETAGIAVAGWLWATGRRRSAGPHYRVQAWWADRLIAALGATCSLRVEVDGAEHLRPGPIVVLARHASLADSLLTAWVLTRSAAMRPRVVMKRELLVDPCLRIYGTRLPNCFVDRDASDSAPELAAIAAMGTGLGPDDAAVLFPEGTRASPAKRRRAMERIADRDPQRAERLGALEHLLPPRPAGATALLGAATDADVVLARHVGFEGLDTFPGILAALAGTPRPVRLHLERVPCAEVPRDPRALAEWLDTTWLRLDREVDAMLGERDGD